MAEVTIKITNCMDCPNHDVIRDPDPHDSFNIDDMAVICKLTENPHRDPKSHYAASRQDRRCVTVSCRPYNLRKESDIPDWCPLKAKTA